MDPIVNIGIKAARSAGNVLMRCLDSLGRLDVRPKGRHDLVSDADQLSEDAIIEIVRKHYPGHSIISEESGAIAGSGDERDAFEWIIDPLDGTLNFLHNHPDFSVSIAVRKNAVMEHAIVFDPLRNDLYTASRNHGAQLNGRRIRATNATSLKRSTISLGAPRRNFAHRDRWHERLPRVVKGTGGVRMSGSAALDLAHVASGRTDGFFQPSLSIWDIAAGSLLVREAKGLVSDCNGQQEFLENGCVVAAGTGIFSEFLGMIQSEMGDMTDRSSGGTAGQD